MLSTYSGFVLGSVIGPCHNMYMNCLFTLNIPTVILRTAKFNIQNLYMVFTLRCVLFMDLGTKNNFLIHKQVQVFSQ